MMTTAIPKMRKSRMTTTLQATKGRSTHTGAVINNIDVNVPISLETDGTKKGVIAFAIGCGK